MEIMKRVFDTGHTTHFLSPLRTSDSIHTAYECNHELSAGMQYVDGIF